jgi:hypothetical protein
MPTSLTLPETPALENLPIDQQMAITALAEGCTFADSAERAGVDRTTLWRWLKSDPRFVSVYEAWKKELAETARATLLKSADVATTTLLNAINKGDAKLALSLLKGLGVLNSPNPK